MAQTRTMRQNYLDMSKGIAPDFLLQYTYGPNPYSKRAQLATGIGPSFLRSRRVDGAGYDIWGVKYVANREAGFAGLPEPGNFILDDITKWRDVVKAPDISDIDWEKMAKKDLEDMAAMGVDATQTALGYNLHVGYFQELMALMGFVEGLCAIQEEPEEVMALWDYMCSFYEEVAKKSFKYYNADFYQLTDDTAAWGAPFISPKQYKELLKPFHAREAQIGLDSDLPIAMHCCGKCEAFVDDWMDFGVRYWDPPQTCNDLLAIQKKWGNKLILTGCFDVLGEMLSPSYGEERFKQDVRDCIDKYSREALFIFDHWVFGDPDNELFNERNRWMTEVVEDYGLHVYGNN